jgi:hypothetical protein
VVETAVRRDGDGPPTGHCRARVSSNDDLAMRVRHCPASRPSQPPWSFLYTPKLAGGREEGGNMKER